MGVTTSLSDNKITYLGKKMNSSDSARAFKAYTKVNMLTSDDVEYSAGTNTGIALNTEIPWGTKEMATAMKNQIAKFSYQPFTATDAILDPAAELGDGITANDVYSGIYTRNINFSSKTKTTVSAPIGEDLDHEFPYVPKQDRKVQRRLHGLTTQLAVTDGKISAEVSNLEKKMNSELAVTDDKISAKVSKQTEDYKTQAFGWSLTENAWQLLNNGTVVFKVNADGALIKGKVTATSGKIGGFTIEKDYLSYNEQTWDGKVTNGGYLGVKGIQLGTNFKVDMQGNLTAKSGSFEGKITAKSGNIGGFSIKEKFLTYDGLTWGDRTKESGIYLGVNGLRLGQKFKVTMDGKLTATDGDFLGTVRANKIVFDEDKDETKLPGAAIKPSSVSGDVFTKNTIGIGKLATGIGTSLGYADYSYGVCTGVTTADAIVAKGGTFKDNLTFQGYDVRWTDIYDSYGTKYTVLARSYE